MRITVLGATGRTGQEIVARAIARGWEVTALVRRPEGLPIRHPNLRVVVGDAREPDAIEAILTGSDAVISSLGIPASGRTREEIDDSRSVDVCLVSTRLLFDAMPRHNVHRIFLMSTHGAGTSNDGSPYVTWLRELVGNRVFDKDRMEEFLAESGSPIRWTVCRNPAIYEGERRPHGVHESIRLDWSSQITYADLAEFALDEVAVPRHSGKFWTITEPLTGKDHP